MRDWEVPLIEGVAKRVGRMSPEELSEQGRRMFHVRGGKAVQRRYRWEKGKSARKLSTPTWAV